jgi:hypothetical protein
MRAQDQEVALGEFTRLGAMTVPLVLLGATTALWLADKAVG